MAGLILIAAACLAIGGAPSRRWTEADAVEYAKSLHADALDRGLPAVSLATWLREAVDVYRLEWFVSDCDLKPGGEPAAEQLLCVGARVSQPRDIDLRFHVVVGNRAEGVHGKPFVMNSFVACNRPTPDNVDVIETFDRLGALSAALERASKRCRAAKSR